MSLTGHTEDHDRVTKMAIRQNDDGEISLRISGASGASSYVMPAEAARAMAETIMKKVLRAGDDEERMLDASIHRDPDTGDMFLDIRTACSRARYILSAATARAMAEGIVMAEPAARRVLT